jgi:hypothetical protein
MARDKTRFDRVVGGTQEEVSIGGYCAFDRSWSHEDEPDPRFDSTAWGFETVGDCSDEKIRPQTRAQ